MRETVLYCNQEVSNHSHKIREYEIRARKEDKMNKVAKAGIVVLILAVLAAVIFFVFFGSTGESEQAATQTGVVAANVSTFSRETATENVESGNSLKIGAMQDDEETEIIEKEENQ